MENNAMSSPKPINMDLAHRIKEYEEDIVKLERRLELKPVVTLEFPHYRVLPDEVLLALRILEKHDRKFMLTYKDLKERSNPIVDVKSAGGHDGN